ncbi:hypothetical protein TWF718_002000 [Orbilia javanica]|uniref:BZIP domain-containing protein n=1 Tax=Orbilia javanica TaxID=47235 RepID=A0AAN8N9E2_9PEZI
MSNLAGEIPATATVTTSKPRKRRKLTEKRRAQNREAQRLFRERKRKKLFETLQQSTDPEYWTNRLDLSVDDSDPITTSVGVSAEVNSTTPATGVRLELPTKVSDEQALNINEAAKQLYDYDVDYAREKRAGRNTSAPRLVSLHWLLNDPNDPTPKPDAVASISDDLATSTDLNPLNTNVMGGTAQIPLDTEILDGPSRQGSASFVEITEAPFDPPPDTGDDVIEIHRPLSVSHPAGFFAPTPVEQASGGYSLKDILEAGLEALASKDRQLDIRLSRSQRVREREQWEEAIEDISTKALHELLIYTPPPCRTHINLDEITTFKAVVINAKMIGLWNPMPEDFKDPYKSPFVQAYFMNDQSVEKVKEKFAGISEGLQPSALQCRTPHKAYIDVFPFPAFRERVIEEGSKGLLNEIEFCADLGKSALMCWGHGQGKHGGEPWNPRSWEAQPWFMKKWESLIDDELRECSKFWSDLRDEGREVSSDQASSFTPDIVLC